MSQSETSKKIIHRGAKYRLSEGALILIVCFALYMLLTLVTYHHSDPAWSTSGVGSAIKNAGGKVGAYLSDISLYIFGFSAYLLPFLVAGFAYMVFRHHEDEDDSPKTWWGLRFAGLTFFVASLSGLFNLYLTNVHNAVPLNAGGLLGVYVGSNLANEFSIIGTTLLLVAAGLIGLTLLFGISWITVCKVGFQQLGALSKKYVTHLKERREAKKILKADAAKNIAPAIVKPIKPKPIKPAPIVMQKPKAKEAPPRKKIPKVLAGKTTADLSNDSDGALPDVSLLDAAGEQVKAGYSPKELEMLSNNVEVKLAEFGIQVKVVAVYPGPVVTRFELELAAGMKVSKIVGLAKDLARSLSKNSVRVVEVIPGKAVIGLEIPNEHREMVRLREILEAPIYQNAESLLTLGLGKDVAGNPVVADIAKMPHLLVAGTTGAGKSVSVNAMILSLLFKASPEDVRLIMIDPKMLELSIYEGIPHLLCPVVTDMKEAANALRWSVAEMDRRYRLMSALSVRNLAGFNRKIREAIAEGNPIVDPFFPDDMGGVAPDLETLPQIVIVIDELADMMMVVGKKVEELIARIAQKARAAGIHMVLATQRPSVDVITGLIKANVPTRIAFQVSSRIDSRTILDQQGAEQLLGHGDMLYLPPGTAVPVRVHGAFVDDDEVIRVVAAWKKRGSPNYKEEVLSGKRLDGSGIPGFEDESDDPEQDPIYDQAVAFITETRRASISAVQRRFKIGYNRAARIVEAMEMAGVVGPMEGGSREVLVSAPPKD